MTSQADRLALRYNTDSHRRIVAGKEVIVHCHHYNARLQNTVESAARIDGKAIIVTAAETVFHEYVRGAVETDETTDEKWAMVKSVYGHLGFGVLDLSEVDEGVVTAPSSHYVEGWATGFRQVDGPVCTFTSGFLQGAIAAVTGSPVNVSEVECVNSGAKQCRFEVEPRTEAVATNLKSTYSFTPMAAVTEEAESNIDSSAIQEAIVGMPLHGNDDGLIPAFGVYLANTPADYYNNVCVRFIEAMREVGEADAARRLLLHAGETCAMNTFRGIMASPEWEGLVAPMVKDQADNLFALVALSNAFGWGNWAITEHEPEQSMTVQSLNGYEAYGAMDYSKECDHPQCHMLTGVATGMMELVYSTGLLEDRFGTFDGGETGCIATSASGRCQFEVEAA